MQAIEFDLSISEPMRDFWQKIRKVFDPPRQEIHGACRMTGNCCRSLILVEGRRPIRSHRQFRRARLRNAEYETFKPRDEVGSDGLLRFRCQNLGDDNRCRIYADRPEICREYPMADMLAAGGNFLPGCGYRIGTGVAHARSFAELLEHIVEREVEREIGQEIELPE